MQWSDFFVLSSRLKSVCSHMIMTDLSCNFLSHPTNALSKLFNLWIDRAACVVYSPFVSHRTTGPMPTVSPSIRSGNYVFNSNTCHLFNDKRVRVEIISRCWGFLDLILQLSYTVWRVQWWLLTNNSYENTNSKNENIKLSNIYLRIESNCKINNEKAENCSSSSEVADWRGWRSQGLEEKDEEAGWGLGREGDKVGGKKESSRGHW